MPQTLTHNASRLTEAEWTGASPSETFEAGAAFWPTIVVRLSRPGHGWSLLTEDPGWLDVLVAGLARIAQLPPNWDSYRAPAISIDAIRSAVEVMKFHATQRTPAPEVVPLSSGGVQLEWHENGVDFEISCRSDQTIEFSIENQRTGAAWDGTVRRFSPELARAFETLTAR